MFAPDCMTADELELWQAANTVAHHPLVAPCGDCPASWAAEMRANGRCNRLERRTRSDKVPTERRRAQWREANRRRVAKARAA